MAGSPRGAIVSKSRLVGEWMGGFYFSYGREYKQLILKNIEFNSQICPVCEGETTADIIFDIKRGTIYGLGGPGKVIGSQLICLECGGTYELKGRMLMTAIEIFKEATKDDNGRDRYGRKKIPGIDFLTAKAERQIEEMTCKYCKKMLRTKKECDEHQKICAKRPKRKSIWRRD